MKKLICVVCFIVVSVGTHAQGLVKFQNTATSLVSGYGSPFEPNGPFQPPSYFALLTAPVGTTDPLAFTFAGIYATNTGGGRFQGGPSTGVAVPGWAGGTSRSFEVASWSADLGPTWNSVWLTTPPWVYNSWFGLSSIGSGVAGGTDSLGNPLPALALFGAAPAISSGFYIAWVPEPSITALAGLAIVLLMVRHGRER